MANESEIDPGRLTRGDLLPRMRIEVPGPKSRAFSTRLRDLEPPGVNTLYGGQDNLLWLEAKGANVLDVDGNRYIDLTSGFGVASIGHRHPKIVESIRQQSDRLVHGLGDAAAHPGRIEVAATLRRLSGIEQAQTYFAISGADAVEIAVKTALLFQAKMKATKEKLIAFEPAYHGLTFGALALSSRPTFRSPFGNHLTPKLERLPFACSMKKIQAALAKSEVAAVIVEPVVGREGVLIPPDGWLAELSDSCRRYGALLITDEIFTGFGRTGQFFAADHEGVEPDLLVCGKALGGGLPIGAVLGRKEVMAAWQTSGEALHTATFLAHPLACAAAQAALEVIEKENLPERARLLGARIEERLVSWMNSAALHDVRGRGLLWGLEFHSAEQAATFTREAWSLGLLMLAGGPLGRVAQIVPPLTITERQLEFVLDSLENILPSIAERRPEPLADE